MKNHIGAPGCLFWTALLLGCPSLAPCQSATTGALAGTVRNPAGDPLPDVTVTLTDAATNQIQTSSTGPNGGYRFGLLTPGTYEARFAAPGFKTARLQSVVVSVSEAPTLDAALEVGKPADQAECQCHLNIVTSSTGDLVNAKTITAVPLTTRNFTQVLSMSSGSAADVNNAGTLGRGTRNVNVNGNTSAGAYSLDGAFAPSAVPNPDTISELKIHTSQYDAVYGAQVPSTALITKSGEKDFHDVQSYLTPTDAELLKVAWPQENITYPGPLVQAQALPGAQVLARSTLPMVPAREGYTDRNPICPDLEQSAGADPGERSGDCD